MITREFLKIPNMYVKRFSIVYGVRKISKVKQVKIENRKRLVMC